MSKPHATQVDPDFASEVLRDLYRYRPKRRWVAWVLWILFGWMGGHRFYVERPVTGLAMLLTGGGALIWWIVDAWLVNGMVRAHNEEQARREAAGLPPIELAFMPPLGADVLSAPPAWTVAWHRRGFTRRALRFSGDVLVLLVAGVMLGALAGMDGATEAAFAVVALTIVVLLGGEAGWLVRVPLAHALLRWSHRLRLFYYYNRPGTPPGLLVRGFLGILLAPFRRRDRAEVRLYIELGAVFTLGFMAFDLVEDVFAPMMREGLSALSPWRLGGLWMKEASTTFVVTYAFAAPIGAVLTLYQLTQRTHTLPRVLGVFVLLSIALTAF